MNHNTFHADVLTVGDLSRRTGIPIKAVRDYTDQGLVHTIGRSPAGYRTYTSEALWCLTSSPQPTPHASGSPATGRGVGVSNPGVGRATACRGGGVRPGSCPETVDGGCLDFRPSDVRAALCRSRPETPQRIRSDGMLETSQTPMRNGDGAAPRRTALTIWSRWSPPRTTTPRVPSVRRADGLSKLRAAESAGGWVSLLGW